MQIRYVYEWQMRLFIEEFTSSGVFSCHCGELARTPELLQPLCFTGYSVTCAELLTKTVS